MKYRRIGKSGLVVSEIAYGSWLTFANQVEMKNARKIVARAFELGVNYIDSADVYEKGKAEELLGSVLPDFNRRQYIIATKTFWPMSDAETDKGLSRKHIMDSIEGSLDRLKLKYVDIYYCHRFDPDTELEETLEAMDAVIRRGKATYWGTSEWTADQIIDAVSICGKRGWHKPIINQPKYNILERKIEKAVLPATMKLGMGTANFSPLAHGVLTGKYSGGSIPEGSRGSNNQQNLWMKDHVSDLQLLGKVDSLKPMAMNYGLSIAQLSLAWILHHPGISSVIMGATTLSQVEGNVLASGVKLRDEDYNHICRLFPAG